MDRILVDLITGTVRVVPFTPAEEAAFLSSVEHEPSDVAPTEQTSTDPTPPLPDAPL